MDTVCGLAAETKVETPEGGLAIRTVAGKAIAVFTREATGRVRFRMMQNVRRVAEQQSVLMLTLETGHAFRVAPYQVLFKTGLVEGRADLLRAGDVLASAFHYPPGYRFRDDVSASVRESVAGLRVASIEPGGTADIYSLSVHQTGCFLLTAGVLCRAEAAASAAKPEVAASPQGSE
jgi:hypothetical protein